MTDTALAILWAASLGAFMFACGFLTGEKYRSSKQLEVAKEALDFADDTMKKYTAKLNELEKKDE